MFGIDFGIIFCLGFVFVVLLLWLWAANLCCPKVQEYDDFPTNIGTISYLEAALLLLGFDDFCVNESPYDPIIYIHHTWDKKKHKTIKSIKDAEDQIRLRMSACVDVRFFTVNKSIINVLKDSKKSLLYDIETVINLSENLYDAGLGLHFVVFDIANSIIFVYYSGKSCKHTLTTTSIDMIRRMFTKYRIYTFKIEYSTVVGNIFEYDKVWNEKYKTWFYFKITEEVKNG